MYHRRREPLGPEDGPILQRYGVADTVLFGGHPVVTIYKICPADLWREAERIGAFHGSAVDRRDGFIHCSTGAQAAETAEKHFSGQRDLVLVAVDASLLGDRLRWEPSRGGALFPHLYGELPTRAAHRVEALPLGPDGRHVFPELDP